MMNDLYAFNTRSNANPANPDTFSYAMSPVVAYVVAEPTTVNGKTVYRKMKVVTSYGAFPEWHVSGRVTVHKQGNYGYTGHDYGQVIVGFVDQNGETTGYVPNRQLPYYVAK